jgi:peptidoglycan/xylan/chitin deacetylase (PgdA/CDA1 family)
MDGGSTTSPTRAFGHRGRALAPSRARTRPRLSRRARQAPSLSSAIARVRAAMPYVAIGGRHHHEVALTFDDGPGPYTLAVLRALRRRHVPATFFQVGFSEHWFTVAERAEQHDAQFVIGDHTETHPRLDRLSPAAQAAQIDQQAAVLRAAGVPRPLLFRPPYGTYDRATLALLRRRGMLMVMWSVDSHDYLRPGVGAIIRRVLAGVRPGAIVLMHDAGGDRSQTVAALPRIIDALRRRHFRLVTVPRLLRDDPPPLRQPALVPGVG